VPRTIIEHYFQVYQDSFNYELIWFAEFAGLLRECIAKPQGLKFFKKKFNFC